MTEQEIAAIEKRLELATKGQWKFMLEGRDHTSGDSFIMTAISNQESINDNSRGDDIYLTGATIADCEFIANAIQDIPKLLYEIKKLRIELGHTKTT